VHHQVQRALSEPQIVERLGGSGAEGLVVSVDELLQRGARALAADLAQSPDGHLIHFRIRILHEGDQPRHGAAQLHFPGSARCLVPHRRGLAQHLGEYCLRPDGVGVAAHGEHGTLAHERIVIIVGTFNAGAHPLLAAEGHGLHSAPTHFHILARIIERSAQRCLNALTHPGWKLFADDEPQVPPERHGSCSTHQGVGVGRQRPEHRLHEICALVLPQAFDGEPPDSGVGVVQKGTEQICEVQFETVFCCPHHHVEQLTLALAAILE